MHSTGQTKDLTIGLPCTFLRYDRLIFRFRETALRTPADDIASIEVVPLLIELWGGGPATRRDCDLTVAHIRQTARRIRETPH